MFRIRKSIIKLQEANLVEKNSFYEKIKYFPFFLVVWWICPMIHRIYQLIVGEESFILAVIHIFFESSYGCINMLVYAMNPKVRIIIIKKFRIFFGSERIESPENSANSLIINN